MRLPLLALLVATSAAPLSAQIGIIHTGRPAQSTTAAPSTRNQRDDNFYGHDQYRILEPKLTMDSMVRLVERKYTGWFVRSKQLVRECQGPVYLFDMISGGAVGEHLLRIDGDTGEVLNPEVIGQKPDSVLVPSCGYHREAYRTSTSP